MAVAANEGTTQRRVTTPGRCPRSTLNGRTYACTAEAEFQFYVSWQLLEDLLEVAEDEVIPDWYIATNDALHYLPMELHLKMTPGFYRGYLLAIEAATRILRREQFDRTSIPTPAAIQARLDPIAAYVPDSAQARLSGEAQEADALRAFFGAGGKLEFALEALTDRAMEKSPEGAEFRRRVAWQEEEEEFEEDNHLLPQCAHDLDFELVRTHLGLPAKSIGPHWFFLTDDSESDEGNEEDEQSEEEVASEDQEAVPETPVPPPQDIKAQ